jgi:hypothetical protein
MKINHVFKRIRATLLGASLFLGAQLSHADSYRVTVDTTALPSDPTGPFALYFQFNGFGPNTNTITVSNFDFNSASLGANDNPAADRLGAVTGDLYTEVTLATTAAFNEFLQGFDVGSILTFDVEFSSPTVNSPTPDLFGFGILDNTGGNIHTGGFGNSLFTIQFDGSTPTVQSYTALEHAVTVSFGPVPPSASVPDTGTTFGLLGVALLGMVVLHQSSRFRSMFAA